MDWYVNDPDDYSKVVADMIRKLTAAVEGGRGSETYGIYNPKSIGERAPVKHFTVCELLQELKQNPDSRESHVFVDRFVISKLKG